MIISNYNAFFLLLLIPLIILLHIVMRRMESSEVSSLLIWERVGRKKKYRLPTYLILLLQILLVGAFSLSLAGIKVPFTIPLRRENSVLVIDNSASMNVREDNKTRLDDAKEKAVNVIKGSLGEIMIITCSNPPEIISSYSNNHDELIKAVRSIKSTELRNGVESAMKIANASVTPEGSIIMISDGAFDFVPSETDNFKFIRAGREETDNLAITDFNLREKISTDSYELYIGISNYSGTTKDYNIEILKGNETIESLSGQLLSGASENRIISIDSESEQEIKARLTEKDLLDSDDSASAYISSSSRKRVLLVTPGNFFLEKSLEAIPGVYIEKFTGMPAKDSILPENAKPTIFSSSGIPIQEIPDNFDVVIYDRIPPMEKDESGRFIYIDVLPSGLRDSEDKIVPQAVSSSLKHPVTRAVDLSQVSVLQARPPLSGPQIKELVTGGNTGLLYALESKYLKFIYFPFDLTDSDLPLRASFPILISNSINWLTEEYAREEINQSRTGDILTTGRILPLFNTSEITAPDGKQEKIDGNIYGSTIKTGLYRMEYGNEFQYHSVNIVSRDESNISPRFPEVTEEDREERTGEYKFPLISILLLLALIILTAEWFVQEDKW